MEESGKEKCAEIDVAGDGDNSGNKDHAIFQWLEPVQTLGETDECLEVRDAVVMI